MFVKFRSIAFGIIVFVLSVVAIYLYAVTNVLSQKNRLRRHSAIGYVSPAEFKRLCA